MSEKYAHTHLRASKRMQKLIGSPIRDLFKQLHKAQLKRHMVGCDIDFTIVEKNPDCIAAFMDIKTFGERVTFAEVIAYNALLSVANLYLLYADGEDGVRRGEFKIHQYLGGNRGPNPPTVKTRHVRNVANWQEFQQWEQEIRDSTK